MILKTSKQKEYELVDSGNGKKLERYGDYLLSRPDPEILWKNNLRDEDWSRANLEFKRTGSKANWIIKNGVPNKWNISFHDLVFSIRPSSFKHTGLFPEQLANWEWMEKLIKNENRKVSVLNLFAYTGGATLICAKAGAEVCHVDGSKNAVSWARDNAELSGLKEAPIRWIIDDVIVFLKREVKRGRKYDAIIMDPPAFGHGPKDEIWKIEEDFSLLIDLCSKVLSDDPLFVVMSGYSAGYSSTTYKNILTDMIKDFKGSIENGELALEESSSKRLLCCGIFARWNKD